jgi:hypothetical protein
MNSFFNPDETTTSAAGKSIVIRSDSMMEKFKNEYGHTIIGD